MNTFTTSSKPQHGIFGSSHSALRTNPILYPYSHHRRTLTLFMLLFLALGQMWGNRYWYAGSLNGWDNSNNPMTVSADGYYEYYSCSCNGVHQFKIITTRSSWDNTLGRNYITNQFNSTNDFNMNSASSKWNENDPDKNGGDNQNCCIYRDNSDAYYILVYYPNTTINASSNAVVCASYYLPNNNSSIVYFVNSNDWAGAIKAYAWYSGAPTPPSPNATWPGANMTNTGETYNGHDIYSYSNADYIYANILFDCGGDECKTGDLILGTENNGKLYNGSGWQAYGRDITIYAIPEASAYGYGTAFNVSTHNLKANVQVGDDEWLASMPLFTKTSYKYNGSWIYKATILAKYNVIKRIQFRVENKSDNSWVEEYDCTPGTQYGADNIDGKIFGGWVNDSHTWYDYATDITLDLQGGSDGSTSVTATVGSAMPSATMPTRTGYTFGGYFTETGGEGTQYYKDDGTSAKNMIIDGPTTLYAKWTPNTYTITLNPNGGTGSTESVEIEYGQTPPNTDALNPYFSITNPTKPGYTFLGWYTAADGGSEVIDENGCFLAPVADYTSNSAGNIWIRPNNATLYAKWNPVVTPIVQYTDNGGEYTTGTTGGTLTINGSSSATGVESGETYTIVATPAAGYCLESLTVGATSLYSQPKSAARQTTAYSNSSQTTTAPVTITAKFAKLKTITLYIFKGSYGGWVLQKYTPQVGNTEVTITPAATLADASHSNWVEVTFTDVTRVTGLSIAREAGAHFQDATVTQSGYYDTDKSALTGFHGKENISYGDQTYMIGDAAITLNPVYIGFATGGTYAWSVTSQPTGGAYSLSSTSVATPTFSATIAGTYTLQVTRTDADGCSASTSFDVIVTARPTTAPTAPTADECQVLSVYSQYYRSLQTSFSDWGSGSTKTDRTIDHVNMWEVNVGTAWADGGFGIEWGGQTFDVSGYTGLHFDVWTPSATTLYVTPINSNEAYNGNDPESRHSGVATTAATWTSVNIPISQFGGATNRNYQLKIEGNKGQMMYLTNIYYYTTSSCPAEPVPVIHSKGIGTAQAQGEWMYCDNNGNIAGSRTNNTVDYYIATLNNEIIYKVITTDGQTMWSDANPFLYVLDAGNGRITEFQGTRNAANTEATIEHSIPGSVDASEFDWNLCVPLVGGTHHWNGRALSEKRTYRRGYVNNPNSDVTAPTVTSAAIKAESVNDGDTTIVVTGAADNSGEYFYYFEDEETGVYHISLSNEYTIPTTTDGRILNVKCYVVDFNGNLSDAKTVTIAMPLDPDTNLALNKPIVAGAGTNIANINDGNRGSRNDGADTGENYTNQWVYIDLEGYYTLSSIKIWFETACPSNYVLQACETLPTPVNDDTRWRTIATRTTAPSTENANVYDVSGSVARYVRIKSYHNYNNNAYGFSIFEFEVYGSAVVPKDVTAPTVTTAEATAIVNNDQLQLHLVANDGSTFFRIKDNETDELFLLEVDGDNLVVLDNKSYAYCIPYSFDIQAMDAAANLSAVSTITPTVAPPALYNLATGATATAGRETLSASHAVDGRADTRWGSEGGAAGEHWITVDLQKKYAIATVKLSWETACPKNYYLKASTDGTNFYPIGHYTTVPATSGNGSAYETYTIPSGVEARYLQMYSVENNTGYGTSIFEFEAYGACATNSTEPLMTFAELKDVLVSSTEAEAEINVGAWDDATAFGSLRYNVEFTAGGEESRNNLTATDGLLVLSALTVGTTYTVRIYVVDGNGNTSANYKEVTFTPMINLYYLTGDATGAAGAWEGALANETSASKRRFAATEHEGIYTFSIAVAGNTQQYRLYFDEEGDLVYRSANWSTAGNQQINNHNGETITVYAKDKDHFVSNFDEVYVYGSAVGAATEGDAVRMTNEGSTFIWQGAVTAGEFRVIVKATEGATPAYTDHSRNRIMAAAETFTNSESLVYATLTFDAATWTFSFERLQNYVIYHHDQAPDGEVEEYAGGTIPQPIEYRRKFEKDTWYSIYFPFDVTAVQVIDDEDGLYYDLKPYYRSSNGVLHSRHYIIRKATPATNMDISKFESKIGESGWLDPAGEDKTAVNSWLPEKNTPYMIQFHNDYYTDKWIVFIGAAGSTFATDFELGDAPADSGFVNIYGNNTLHSTSLTTRTYMINYDEYEGNAWTRFDEGTTLYPFEVYMRAEAKTTEQHQVLGRRPKQEDTATAVDDIYTETSCLRVYTLTGQLLLTLYHITPDDAGRQLQQQLGQGIYILHSDHSSYKLIIGGH